MGKGYHPIQVFVGNENETEKKLVQTRVVGCNDSRVTMKS